MRKWFNEHTPVRCSGPRSAGHCTRSGFAHDQADNEPEAYPFIDCVQGVANLITARQTSETESSFIRGEAVPSSAVG